MFTIKETGDTLRRLQDAVDIARIKARDTNRTFTILNETGTPVYQIEIFMATRERFL